MLPALLVVSIISGISVVCFRYKDNIKISQAGAGHNVLGFAWSENVGWISFNSGNCDADNDGNSDGLLAGCPLVGSPIPDYGVNVDSVTGNFSGYAWSSNVGWISFDKAVAGNPPGAPYNAAETFMAKLNTGTGEFSGWARALFACQDDLWDGIKCTGAGAGDKSGGWDGWIKLRRDPADALPDYGTFLNVSDFEGWAWGDNVVGWISFNSKNCDADNDGFSDGIGNCPVAGTLIASYKVYLGNNPPVITDGGQSMADVCLLGANPQAQFIWGYTDLDGDLQKDYQIEISEDAAFTLPLIYDPGRELNNSSIVFTVPAGVLEYGKEYWYKIRVWDANNAESNVLSLYFGGLKNISHQYPTVVFSYNPAVGITQFQEITFDPSLSQAYGGFSILSYEWDFDYDSADPLEPSLDDSTDPGDPTTVHSYAEVKTYEVNLKVTDTSLDSYSCMVSQSIDVGGADLPRWNEANP